MRGSKLQIRCRLILLISEHPIQRGIRKECWHRIPGNRNRLPGNLDPLQKTAVSGGKTKKKLPKFFLRLRDTYKKYILQKNWSKTAIPALSSGPSNLQQSIWGRHHQLDDQHRNPNMNNKDHLVGQLTRGAEAQKSSQRVSVANRKIFAPPENFCAYDRKGNNFVSILSGRF